MNTLYRLVLCCGLLGLLGVGVGCEDRQRVLIVHADSLTRPLEEVKKAFEAANPGVHVDLEPLGSVTACRKLQSGAPADVVALADRHLFAEQLTPNGLADWSVNFCSNEIVILKSGKSRYGAEISSDNWFEVLTRPDVKVGVADPTQDPCGYWTLLVWQLADRHYADRAMAGQAGPGRRISEAMAAKCTAEFTRPDSQQLIALVEGTGGWDYAFMYRAQAEQAHLSYIALPPEINLGAAEGTPAAAGYARARVTVPAANITRVGEPMLFALSIPKSARQPELAEKFVAFLLSDAGRALCRQTGLAVLDRPWSSEHDKLPVGLRASVAARQP